MIIYSVLPYERSYNEPIVEQMKSFTDKEEAYQFADEWECVELIQNELI